ncbi:membrane protein YdbS with pleckstrin-like domain [Actinokineospora baliensis]|uniref:PH domain-containing protein n=1 Tax=Actinokineospora baliensis TaxID=547056 RepID=UPI0027DD19AE|nr:PH domain-containing protein [Actinokineospora baliensis]MBM7772399.1 membrane protein YdbS with pleckstrin-like domain [Actinokineospora baliensis]
MSDVEWRLRAPANLVSKKAVLLWTLRAVIFWVVVVGAQGVVLLVVDGVPGWVRGTAVGAGVVGVVHTLVMPRWRYRVHRWETTADAVFTRSGWVSQEWRLAPISRIQTVDTARGPLEQLLGLSTITVTTASAQGPLKVEGLDAGVAARVVGELAATTQVTPGDAT